MALLNRRILLAGGSVSAALGLAGCAATRPPLQRVASLVPVVPDPLPPATPFPSAPETPIPAGPPAARYAALYPAIDDKFPIHALRPGVVAPAFWRTEIDYPTREEEGTVIVDPHHHYLYHVLANGRAMRYGVGVGRDGFAWSGISNINSKQEWPDWYPPKEMIERQPELQREVTQLQSGLGVEGGPHNPLGCRAMYLWQNNKDTLYRIHGTTEPGSIGRSVSSGCIRMVNQDAIHLYDRVAVGAKVVVLG